MSRSGRPLAGRVVLVTRPRERSRALMRELERLGARVDARPTIAFEAPVDPLPARRAVASLAGYDWIVCTSPTGVRAFARLLREIGGDDSRPVARIAAIGPGTARQLEQVSLPADVVATDSRAEGLADALRDRVASGQRVLIVRPESARDVLPEAIRALGAHPEPVAFYRTVPAVGVGAVADDLGDGRFDAVVFTSPSTFRNLVEADAATSGDVVLARLRRMRVVAIGSVTAQALESAGVTPSAVADEPTALGLADAVCSAFAD